jgi:hypothetical protein
MKPAGIILIVVAALLLAGSAFFGYFSVRNSGSADRLSRRLPNEAGFVVNIVKRKAEKQMYLALGLGVPAVLVMGGGLVMVRKARTRAIA